MTTISAIVPVFNGRRYLAQAISSAFAQTLPPDELIVVDDGSTDGSGEELERLCESRPTVPLRIIRQANSGQSAARNLGAAAARGEYFAFLDQDDIWYPFHLERLFAAIQEGAAGGSEIGWVYSDVDEIDGDGSLVSRCFVAGRCPHPKTRLADLLGGDMFVMPSAGLVRRSAFEAVGGFDERLSGYEDDDLFLRLFRRGYDNRFLAQSTAQYRLHGANSSTTGLAAESRRIYARKLIEAYPDDRLRGRYYVRDHIAPRFLRSAIAGYTRALAAGDERRRRGFGEEARFFAALGRPTRTQKCAVALMPYPWLFRKALRLTHPEEAWRLTPPGANKSEAASEGIEEPGPAQELRRLRRDEPLSQSPKAQPGVG